jgi:hypothetical protein
MPEQQRSPDPRRDLALPDVSYDDLVELWGAAHVRRLDAKLVEQLPLPTEAKQVLSQVGLPAHQPWLGSDPGYGQESQLPRPVELPGRPGRWCLLADGDGRNWSVAEETGEVVMLNVDSSWPQDYFVNSSLGLFLRFLIRFELWRRHTRQLSEHEAGYELVRLWNVLYGMDPPAFDDLDNAWPANLVDAGWQLGWPFRWTCLQSYEDGGPALRIEGPGSRCSSGRQKGRGVCVHHALRAPERKRPGAPDGPLRIALVQRTYLYQTDFT